MDKQGESSERHSGPEQKAQINFKSQKIMIKNSFETLDVTQHQSYETLLSQFKVHGLKVLILFKQFYERADEAEDTNPEVKNFIMELTKKLLVESEQDLGKFLRLTQKSRGENRRKFFSFLDLKRMEEVYVQQDCQKINKEAKKNKNYVQFWKNKIKPFFREIKDIKNNEDFEKNQKIEKLESLKERIQEEKLKVGLYESFTYDQLEIMIKQVEKSMMKSQKKICKQLCCKEEFYYEEPVQIQSKNIQYKNISFPYTQNNIWALKATISGFLNTDGGYLFLGISEKDGNHQAMVLGYPWQIKSKQLFQRNFQNMILSSISPNCFSKVHFHYFPVKNSERVLIRLMVMYGKRDQLYTIEHREMHYKCYRRSSSIDCHQIKDWRKQLKQVKVQEKPSLEIFHIGYQPEPLKKLRIHKYLWDNQKFILLVNKKGYFDKNFESKMSYTLNQVFVDQNQTQNGHLIIFKRQYTIIQVEKFISLLYHLNEVKNHEYFDKLVIITNQLKMSGQKEQKELIQNEIKSSNEKNIGLILGEVKKPKYTRYYIAVDSKQPMKIAKVYIIVERLRAKLRKLSNVFHNFL